jgi:hypothetical protein
MLTSNRAGIQGLYHAAHVTDRGMGRESRQHRAALEELTGAMLVVGPGG